MRSSHCSPKRGAPASLGELVDEYLSQRSCTSARGRFKSLPTLHETVRLAALSLDERGQCEPHQRRVGRVTLGQLEEALRPLVGEIARCADFESLYNLVWTHRIPGVGPLTVYDVSLRIATKLGFGPTRVYLHTGTAAGAKKLGVRHTGPPLSKAELPTQLHRLTCEQIEDFLCVYKSRLRPNSL